MPKDRLGNELSAGKLVEVKLDSPSVVGRIKQITEGGLSLAIAGSGTPPQMTPGVITIIAEIQVPFHPQNQQLPGVLSLVDPETAKVKIDA